MGQVPKDVETFRLLADCLSNESASHVSSCNSMTTVTMREENIVIESSHVGHPANRQADITRPREVNFRILELRESLQYVGSQFGSYITWILAAIHGTATEQQPFVARDTVVVEKIVRVLDAVVPGE